MLPGLSTLETGRLRMSLGYGNDQRGRPLSPVEVGRLLRRTLDCGATLRDCAKQLGLRGPSQLNRFIQVLKLPEDLRHQVVWGRSGEFLGFTTAVQLARFDNPKDQQETAAAILERGMKTDEVRQVVQLRQRTMNPIADCLDEVLGMRPTIERRYVFVGAVGDEHVEARLSAMTQSERDALLHSAMEALDIKGVTGRLGETLFTLVGDSRLEQRLVRRGKKTIESLLQTHFSEEVKDAESEG